MKKVAIFNIKGGVGKTISTVNIAAILAEKGYKVLVVDTDSQSSTSITFEGYDAEGLNLANILLDKKITPDQVIKKSNIENIDILPCNFNLAYAEKEILFDVHDIAQLRFKNNVIDKIENDPKYKYDYCIIDCPPALNIFATNVLIACDEVLIPIKVDRYAYDGISRLIEEIENVQDGLNPKLKLSGCFITMDNNTKISEYMKSLLKDNLGNKLFKTSIRHTVSVTESTFRNMPVVHHKKDSTASIDYYNLVGEAFNV